MKKNIVTKSLFAALLLASAVVSAEEQYPATDFQPTVVYSDGAAASSSSEAPASSKTADVEVKVEKTAEKAESSNNMLFGLIILAVAGGFFLNKKSKCPATSSACHSHSEPSYSGDASGLTGVERYLQSHNASSATGVEKYLARKEAADKEASLTGVDRYLRNRG